MTEPDRDPGEPPVVAEVTRSGVVESVHRAHVAIVDAHGELVAAAGNATAAILPRSCNKPLQAIGMLECGLELPAELLALAGASHAGEPFHVDGVRRILAGAGLDEAALQNPPDVPSDPDARAAWMAAGDWPRPVAMNCSGKHAAMLATCALRGWPTASYLDPNHELQRRLSRAVSEHTSDPAPAVAVDGCGAPVFAASLEGLARAFGRIASASDGSATTRVADAFRAYPEWASGTRRDESLLHRQVPGLMTKAGAEGTYAVGLRDGRGLAVKVDDGAARPRPVIVNSLLQAMGVSCQPAAFAITGGSADVGEIRATRVVAELGRLAS